MKLTPAGAAALLATGLLALAACGGGSNSAGVSLPLVQPPPPPPPPPPPALDPRYLVSAASLFAANCDGVPAAGTLYANAEVEPSLAIDPVNTSNMAAAWQQDRWSTGGARGIVASASRDGGKTWTQHAMPFTRCAGGTPANGGDYERASDAWLSAAPDGTLHQIAIAFSGGVLQPGAVSAVVASRSTDGGATWGATQTLIRDVDAFFNDKCSITADPVTPHYVYAVWDRQSSLNNGPAELARSHDDGQTWGMPQTIYDPGINNQTISNLVVVLPSGILVDFFLEIHAAADGSVLNAFLEVIRSGDNGATWSQPSVIAQLLSVGTRDPKSGARVRDGSLVPQIAVAPGGTLYAVWQDSRFSSGARDGIALARSDDVGLTWSAPVQVNSVTAVAAFLPSLHVRGDGQIGVTYYDFRDNSSNAATLLTDYWLTRSTDGATWHENQIAGPFDLDLAPLTTDGYFLGDYQGLSSVGSVFVPLFVLTNNNAGNRTDVFVAPQVSATAAVAVQAYRVVVPTGQGAVAVAPEWSARVRLNLTTALREGPPGKLD